MNPAETRLLVVDDNEDNRYTLTRQLARAGYKHVVAAQGGREALALMRSQRFDLVLLDIVMPDLDGFEVCQELREEEATRDVPVIFLTALDDTLDKVRAFSVGAVDYLTKPFRSEELLARVSTHLALRQARAALEEQNA